MVCHLITCLNNMLRHRSLVVSDSAHVSLPGTNCTVYPVVDAHVGGAHAALAETLRIHTTCFPSTTVMVALVFPEKTAIGKTVAREVMSHMSHVGRLLVLYPAISSFAQAEFARPSGEGIVEFFSHDDISVDKLQSRLVPRYKVLSEEDICVLETRLKLSRHKLPIMLQTDAMSHYLGFRKNNVIMAIDYNTFRIVK